MVNTLAYRSPICCSMNTLSDGVRASGLRTLINMILWNGLRYSHPNTISSPLESRLGSKMTNSINKVQWSEMVLKGTVFRWKLKYSEAISLSTITLSMWRAAEVDEGRKDENSDSIIIITRESSVRIGAFRILRLSGWGFLPMVCFWWENSSENPRNIMHLAHTYTVIDIEQVTNSYPCHVVQPPMGSPAGCIHRLWFWIHSTESDYYV